MKSIREIYKIGKGPSSSHTMGPERAAKHFKQTHPEADAFRVILYGSLSKTGVGHGTDRVLREVLSPVATEIVFSKEDLGNSHPNTLDFFALKDGQEICLFEGVTIPESMDINDAQYLMDTNGFNIKVVAYAIQAANIKKPGGTTVLDHAVYAFGNEWGDTARVPDSELYPTATTTPGLQ